MRGDGDILTVRQEVLKPKEQDPTTNVAFKPTSPGS